MMMVVVACARRASTLLPEDAYEAARVTRCPEADTSVFRRVLEALFSQQKEAGLHFRSSVGDVVSPDFFSVNGCYCAR
jgi:hypothetical protein